MEILFLYGEVRLVYLLFLYSSSYMQYMVLLPFLIHTDSPEKICVQLTHLNESVTLNAAIEYQGENRSLIDDVVSEKDLFTCIPFTIPKSTSQSTVTFITVTVKGETLQFRSRKSVLVKNSESLVFVQTDKPIYKPGQTGGWRFVLEPHTVLTISLWSHYLYVTFRSHSYVNSPPHKLFSFGFAAVLPKFEVTVKMPKVITILDEKLKVTVCGLYTFGKPVPGHVSFRVCRKFEYPATACYGEEAKAVCDEFSGQVNNHGCISKLVKTKLFQLKRIGYENKLHVDARIEEEETGIVLTGTSFSEITTTISKITFENSDSYYKPGIPFFGQVKLVDGSGAPIANETVRISLQGGQEMNYTTNEEGRAQFALNTSMLYFDSATHKTHSYCFDHSWVNPNYEDGYLHLKRFYSPSQSFLKIEPMSETLSCGSSAEVRVHYILTPEAVREKKKVTFYHLVMAKGIIKQAGTRILDLDKESVNGVFILQLHVEAEFAPIAQVLVYTVTPSREVIADSTKFNVEKCFNNKVGLSFSPSEGLPSSDTHLLFRASPKSLCAVRAVDKSVLLMKSEADLSPSLVSTYSVSKHLKVWSGQEQLSGNSEQTLLVECHFLRAKYDADVDLVCLELSALDSNRIHATPEEVTETIRKYFPETWIWSLVSISSEGNAELGVTIPDTITEWKANAFCMSPDTGFGLSPTVSLRAFQPFFVELTLPYSVVRGEAFTLKATVFNYLTACIRVSVVLAQSTQFLATPVEKEEDSHCLCENGRKTVAWLVTPRSLGLVEFLVSTEALQNQQPCRNTVVETPEKGRKDTVIRQLLVEPEGVEKETVQNSVLCLKGKSVKEKFSLLLPSNVVQDSGRAYFSVLGDLMGTAMQNLHQLLQMPFGCGEQNMVLFAPNIYVLDYLNKTGQLSEEVKSKAIGYLVSGYQRQMNYKHPDGSYSTFGPRYGQPGNTWLTAFVLKSFAQARSYIFIDEKHIQDALIWLSQNQKENGCFRSSGRLLNNAMKGGVNDEVTLTAYITIALLEIPLPVTHSVVRNALFCLETAGNEKENHVYTKALLAYAFALAGKEEKRKAFLGSLEKEAVKKDGSVHWQRPGKEPEADLPYYHYKAPSAEVEMTAYVLLAYLTTQPAPSQEELSLASLIAKWIIGQQNPNGGFSSTQVTGERALPAASHERWGAVRMGKGESWAGRRLRYNVQPKQESAPFLLHVHTSPETCEDSKAHRVFDIGINVSYTGERSVSNMVIIDVKMLSGFIPVKSSVRKVGTHLSNTTLSFSFTVEQDIPVQGLKPAQVKVYDYYETGKCGAEGVPVTVGSRIHGGVWEQWKPTAVPGACPSAFLGEGPLTALLSLFPSVFQMSLPYRSTVLPAPQVGYIGTNSLLQIILNGSLLQTLGFLCLQQLSELVFTMPTAGLCHTVVQRGKIMLATPCYISFYSLRL
uniref:Alpha-2-macroglobulin n=1 Tax=Chrysolophus pictus TaxID=9089 RepID=A0A8C3LZ48_CHRPC